MSGVIAWSFTNTRQQSTPNQPVPTRQQEQQVSPSATNTSPAPTPAGKSSTNIIVRKPIDNEDVGQRFEVTGEARVFENVVSYRVKNQKNNAVYVSGNTTADAPDIGQFGPFTITVILPDTLSTIESGDTLLLEVFQQSPRDGSDADLVSIPLRFRVGE